MFDYLKGLETLFSLIAILFGAAAFAHSWITRGAKVNAAKLTRHGSQIGSLEVRVGKVEDKLGSLPDKDDFHALSLQMTSLCGDLNTVSTRLEGVDRIARRIDDHLLNNGGSHGLR